MKMCIAEEIIDKKTNEIPTTAKILGKLNVEGCIITWDALNTQKENISAVINASTNKSKSSFVLSRLTRLF